MPSNVRRFELYHDSAENDLHEDVQRIRTRVADFAEHTGIDYDVTDVADWPQRELNELLDELQAALRSDREYHVGREILTRFAFVRLRPLLVIRYEDPGTGIDIYPHRFGDIPDGRVISIVAFIDQMGEMSIDGKDELPIDRIDRRIVIDGYVDQGVDRPGARERSRSNPGIVNRIKQLFGGSPRTVS